MKRKYIIIPVSNYCFLHCEWVALSANCDYNLQCSAALSHASIWNHNYTTVTFSWWKMTKSDFCVGTEGHAETAGMFLREDKVFWTPPLTQDISTANTRLKCLRKHLLIPSLAVTFLTDCNIDGTQLEIMDFADCF